MHVCQSCTYGAMRVRSDRIVGGAETTVPRAGNHVSTGEMATPRGVCDFHSFPDLEELDRFRSELLGWYDVHKRELPWRTLVSYDLSCCVS